MKRALVTGASGFLGSHITKQLVATGQPVRIFVRPSSNTTATDHLTMERCYGDVQDMASLHQAMSGCDVVYHCIVDARAWLRDPRPLYRTNVDGLRHTMDAALAAGVKKFVFCSSYVTIGRNAAGPSTESDAFDWYDEAPDYVRCRVDAENLLLAYVRDRGLPAVACCIGNTYGEADVQPTPHGKLLKDVATGRLPVYWEGGGPSLNIKDAAAGMILAAAHGEVGQRYILGGPYTTFRELFAMAARAVGRRPPSIRVPMSVIRAAGALAEVVARPLDLENKLHPASIECATLLPAVSSAKAERKLGWCPGPLETAVREAVHWYLANP